jgi:homoserine acetyltransferase
MHKYRKKTVFDYLQVNSESVVSLELRSHTKNSFMHFKNSFIRKFSPNCVLYNLLSYYVTDISWQKNSVLENIELKPTHISAELVRNFDSSSATQICNSDYNIHQPSHLFGH